jgi:hypothetical protein
VIEVRRSSHSDSNRWLILRIVRRVKCDEEKPFCNKCTSTGRACDGYDMEGSPGRSSSSDNPSATAGRTLTLVQSPSVESPSSPRERRSMQFFYERTVRKLNPFGADDFWDIHILRATHHEPSIRHAIVALGSLHEKFEESRGLAFPDGDNFSLQQYNKAIGSLLKPFSSGGQQTMDVCLTASILFACFEVRTNDYLPGLANDDNVPRHCKVDSDQRLLI